MLNDKCHERLLDEEEEQERAVVWMTKKNVLHFSIPNAGKRSLSYAMKLKRTGLKPGVPDLFIPIMAGPYGGLFIEMKRKKGGILSDAQHYWIGALRKQGYYVEVCRGMEALVAEVEKYLALGVVMPDNV